MTVQTQEAQNPVQTTEQKKDPQTSFAEVRKILEAERAEKQALQKRVEELERNSKKTAQPNYQVQTEDDDLDEPYLDPRTFKKKMAKFEETLDQKIERKAEEKARTLIEEQNRHNYLKQNSDFEKMMAPDMIQKFADKFPTMAEAILRMPDNFERQKLVYEVIKGTGVHNPEPEKETIQQRIDANRRSPYYQPSGGGNAPYNAVGDFSPVGQKNAYEKLKELKSRLRIG